MCVCTYVCVYVLLYDCFLYTPDVTHFKVDVILELIDEVYHSGQEEVCLVQYTTHL